MAFLPLPSSFTGAAAGHGLFGGNILAPRAPMTGEGSYAAAIEALGVTTLRYPGGSLTEDYFDIADPDSLRATHNETGETVQFMPLSDIMTYSANSGNAVAIVLPTREYLSATEIDANGDRMPDIDEAVLRGFVRDVVSGEYGDGQVSALEIGNEYWGAGRMNAAEYGRLATQMTQIIDSELTALAPMQASATDVEIVVQMGTNFGYSALDDIYDGMSSQEVVADIEATYGITVPDSAILSEDRFDWTEINNEIVINALQHGNAFDLIDGVTGHVYSRAPVLEHTRYFQLEQLVDSWIDVDPALEIHITEWNQRSGTNAFDADSDYGLYQAQEMLEMVEEFMRVGVDEAQVWPLIQNTPSALSNGFDYTASTAPGEMFAMMSEALPGMTMLDFAPGENRDTEFTSADFDAHVFADGSDMVLYVTSNLRDGVVQGELDLSNLVQEVGQIGIDLLGVAPGQEPGSNQSDALRETLEAGEVFEDGVLDVLLAPGEIMQVVLSEVTPTDDFEEMFEQSDASYETTKHVTSKAATPITEDEAPSSDDLIAALSQSSEGDAQTDGFGTFWGSADDGSDDASDDDGGDDMGLGWALALLPLLGLLGLG